MSQPIALRCEGFVCGEDVNIVVALWCWRLLLFGVVAMVCERTSCRRRMYRTNATNVNLRISKHHVPRSSMSLVL